MSAIETAILCAGLLALSLLLGESLKQQQADLYKDFPFFAESTQGR